jgi:hypothetical protein
MPGAAEPVRSFELSQLGWGTGCCTLPPGRGRAQGPDPWHRNWYQTCLVPPDAFDESVPAHALQMP